MIQIMSPPHSFPACLDPFHCRQVAVRRKFFGWSQSLCWQFRSLCLLAVLVILSVGSSTVSHPHKRRPMTAVSCYLLSRLSWPAAGHLPKPPFFVSTRSFCMLRCSMPTTVPEAAPPPPHTHTSTHTPQRTAVGLLAFTDLG